MTFATGQAGIEPRGKMVFSPGYPGHPPSPGTSVKKGTLFTSGCVELDYRVFGGCLYEGLEGRLVGLSADGDVGLMVRRFPWIACRMSHPQIAIRSFPS